MLGPVHRRYLPQALSTPPSDFKITLGAGSIIFSIREFSKFPVQFLEGPRSQYAVEGRSHCFIPLNQPPLLTNLHIHEADSILIFSRQIVIFISGYILTNLSFQPAKSTWIRALLCCTLFLFQALENPYLYLLCKKIWITGHCSLINCIFLI